MRPTSISYSARNLKAAWAAKYPNKKALSLNRAPQT